MCVVGMLYDMVYLVRLGGKCTHCALENVAGYRELPHGRVQRPAEQARAD